MFRLSLLRQIGIEPIVEVSGYDEQMDNIQVSTTEFLKECSRGKARVVAERLKKDNRSFDIVIGCDTVIEFKNEVIGKPRSDEDALRVLKMLAGNTHRCLTGLTLIDSNLKEDTTVTETIVEFSDIPDAVLKNYIESGEHRGCAGSYRIQGRAAGFIKSINGCYHNVVGLPLQVLIERMRYMIE